MCTQQGTRCCQVIVIKRRPGLATSREVRGFAGCSNWACGGGGGDLGRFFFFLFGTNLPILVVLLLSVSANLCNGFAWYG